MGTKIELSRGQFPGSLVQDVITEHDADVSALLERAERAEEGLGFEKQVAHGLSMSLNSMRAERDRLRKLFDDAGQGEHNVLALVDHYQEQALDRDRLAAELAKAEADLAEAVDGAAAGEAAARADQHARDVSRVRDVVERHWAAPDDTRLTAGARASVARECLAALTGDAAPKDPTFVRCPLRSGHATDDLSTALGAPPGESWDALLGRVRGMVGEQERDAALAEVATCRARLRAVATALGVTLLDGQSDVDVERWCLEMAAKDRAEVEALRREDERATHAWAESIDAKHADLVAARAEVERLKAEAAEAPKPEPAAPAPPPLPEVPDDVRDAASSGPGDRVDIVDAVVFVARYIVALDAALRAERGGQ